MNRFHFLSILLLLVSFRQSEALMAQPRSVVERLDSLFTAPGNFESLNGSVLIAEKGKIIYQRSFGLADRENKIANAPGAAFDIASNTKTFTSTAILQLKEKGKLSLGEPFKKYFPAFPFPAITIRHLLTHQSGLPDLEIYFDLLEKEPGRLFSNADIIPALIHYNKPLKFQPGDAFDYCNTNFELLALLVEKISGMPFPDYLQKFVFGPAGMNHTFFRGFAQKNNNPAVLVKNYMPRNFYSDSLELMDSVKRPRIHQIVHNLPAIYGDGGIISTMEDMFRYSEALYNGKLLKPATQEEAYTPAGLHNAKDYHLFSDLLLGKIQYGLGWAVDTDSARGKIVSHGGHYAGIWSSFLRNTSAAQTVVAYDNTDWSGADLISRMALDIINGWPIKNVLLKKSMAASYGHTLMRKGPDAAFCALLALREDTIHYRLRQSDMNALGYQFLQAGLTAQSLETFKVNALLFPTSFNVYDSYADALADAGEKEAAMAMYKKSIRLNPGNEDGKNKLNKLLADTH